MTLTEAMEIAFVMDSCCPGKESRDFHVWSDGVRRMNDLVKKNCPGVNNSIWCNAAYAYQRR